MDRVVTDGETLDLGNGVKVEFYEVPGHSKCCLATYVPSCKALFPTDTMPFPVDAWCDLAFPSAQYDFDCVHRVASSPEWFRREHPWL